MIIFIIFEERPPTYCVTERVITATPSYGGGASQGRRRYNRRQFF